MLAEQKVEDSNSPEGTKNDHSVTSGFLIAATRQGGANASRRGAGAQVTSSTAERSPFPSRGRTMRPVKEDLLPLSGAFSIDY